MPGPMRPRPKNGGLDRARNFKGTMKKLLSYYLLKYKWQLILVLLFAIGGTIFTIVGPKILGNATTEIYNGIVSKLSGGAGINFEKIANILITLLALYALSSSFSVIQGFLMTNVSQKMTYKMRNDLIGKINRLPMKYFDTKTDGEVLSIITNDIDTLSMNLNQSIIQVVTSVCTVIGILVMMLSISFSMTLVSLAILPFTTIMVVIIVKKSQKYFKKQQDYIGHVNGRVEEAYGGFNVVKAFNAEEKTINDFQKQNQELYNAGWRAQFLSGLMRPIMNFIGNLSYVAISILGGYFALKGRITVGDIQSFIQYSRQFNQPIAQIAEISAILQEMAAAAERIFDFLEGKEEIQHIKNAKKVGDLKGNIKFENVKFGYDDDKLIIHDFNATVKDGQKVAIVGPTGAGKTTMVKLLMRFYDINDGAIYIDGNNIADYDRSDIRALFGMVLQDTWLFNGTVKENIRYGKPDATDSEVIDAAKAANVHHFIKTLPNGYDMVLNEETSNISAGQKQLLTIARVILANPKILILDEATSSIDTRTEIKIQEAMDNLMKGRTSFIIAHRLSTIKNADLILVMEHGDIVEQGNHEELLARNGAYAKLYNSQFDEEEE